MCRIDADETNISARGLYQVRLENSEKMLAREQNMARLLHHTHALSSFSRALLNYMSQRWEVYYSKKKDYITPSLCKMQRGFNTASLSDR
jgi:hypothetical protein